MTGASAPLPLAAAAVALVLYAKGFVRLRRRRPTCASPGQAAAFCAGVLVALLAVLSPLDGLAETKLLTAHMAQHLLLGDVAPLLLVLGLRGPLALFVVPPAVLAGGGALAAARVSSRRAQAAVALSIWVGTMYAWHVPALYDAAVASPALHAVEHASFLAVGPARVDGDPRSRPQRRPPRRVRRGRARRRDAARRGPDRGLAALSRTTPRSPTDRSA